MCTAVTIGRNTLISCNFSVFEVGCHHHFWIPQSIGEDNIEKLQKPFYRFRKNLWTEIQQTQKRERSVCTGSQQGEKAQRKARNLERCLKLCGNNLKVYFWNKPSSQNVQLCGLYCPKTWFSIPAEKSFSSCRKIPGETL